MDFPHLGNERFPDIDNVNVYARKNEFDYTRWVPNTRIKLCNVRWNGDYADVVKFDTNDERDEWFDSLPTDSECVVMLTNDTLMNDGAVKVPIPYDVAARYNYMVVDVPVMPSADHPIDYESANGFRRWHFFVNGLTSTAPSVTRLNVALDVWTQYANEVGVSYMVLERGHAPVAGSDTDEYLANPMSNSGLLLAPDVDFGGETIARGGRFVPFGNGSKLVCIASSCTPQQVDSIGSVTDGSSASFSDPTFSDEVGYPNAASRWGHQYHVDGYGFGSGRDFSSACTSAGNSLSSDGRVPNNVTVYAVPASDAYFVSDVTRNAPNFLRTALAFFDVDENLVTLGARHTVAGHVVYECVGNDVSLGDVTLTRDMFAIPPRYQRFAKLYTHPYSELEVTDNAGKTVTVRVESTGAMSARAITSVAYPYLNMRMFLTGIGGVGSQSYEWRDLRGAHECEMPNSDWRKFCFDFDIPMFSLYMDGATSWQLQNYNRSLSNARISALTSYHNDVRGLDNARENAVDAANTIRDNAVRSANTNETNSDNTANTARNNSYNDAATIDSNNANNRACASDITATNNATAHSDTNVQLAKQLQDVVNGNANMSTMMAADNATCVATANEQNQVTVAKTNTDNATNIGGGVINAVAMGAAAGLVGGPMGAAVGAIGGGVSSIVGAVFNSANSGVITQANSAVAGLQVTNNSTHVNGAVALNNTNQSNAHTASQTITNNDTTRNTSNTKRDNARNAANTANTTGTIRTNATNSRDTAVTNAANTRSTSVTNANATRDNAESNATWTRESGIAAAQDTLRNTQRLAKAELADARNAAPLSLTPTSGNATDEYMRTRGVQVRVRTQSGSAIRMAGDTFARYGYALNQIWDVEGSGLKLMRHFTYWKASECWVYDKDGTSDVAQNSIAAILRNGVTVWNDPNEIGRVSPYDN